MKVTTVVILKKNEGAFGALLDSIQNQTRPIDELIVYCQNNQINKDKINNDLNEYSFVYSVSSKLELCLKKAKGEIIFFAVEDMIWNENRVEEYMHEFESSKALLLMSDALINNNQSALNYHGYKTKKKLLIAEGKSDQVFAKLGELNISLIALDKKALKHNIFPLIDNQDLSKWLLSILSSQFPDRIALLDKVLGEFVKNVSEETKRLEPKEINKENVVFLESVLKKVENNSFRRAHYFWYMRSLLEDKSFLAKFISINTLFLEGDYKRFTNQPIRNALSDLFN